LVLELYRQHRPRPCKKRKDGPPEIPFWEEKSKPVKGLATRQYRTVTALRRKPMQ